ncbi:hypothetical protein O1L60_33655 [Streptomyces diastatochromogenes]|nr:hypothetical protein [Streptomyces diastatochromogenes]
MIPAGGTRPTDDVGLLVAELEDRLDPEGTRRDGPEWLAPSPPPTASSTRAPPPHAPPPSPSPPRHGLLLTRGLFTGAWAVPSTATSLLNETRSRLLALPTPTSPPPRISRPRPPLHPRTPYGLTPAPSRAAPGGAVPGGAVPGAAPHYGPRARPLRAAATGAAPRQGGAHPLRAAPAWAVPRRPVVGNRSAGAERVGTTDPRPAGARGCCAEPAPRAS